MLWSARPNASEYPRFEKPKNRFGGRHHLKLHPSTRNLQIGAPSDESSPKLKSLNATTWLHIAF
jgi:hypothetical protein